MNHSLQNHREFQKVVRKFFDEVVYPDAQAREADGKRASQEVFDKMACVSYLLPFSLPLMVDIVQ